MNSNKIKFMNNNFNNYKLYTTKHPFFLLRRSYWPLFLSISLGCFMVNTVFFLHSYSFLNLQTFCLQFLNTLICIFGWFSCIIRESSIYGKYSKKLQSNIRTSFILFIVSEIMLFATFLVSFLYCSTVPSIFIGLVWPPYKFITIDPCYIPLLNTFILLYSCVILTFAHKCILRRINIGAFFLVPLVVLTGLCFLLVQFMEYSNSHFSINDSVYGSLFYLTTGFHGMHVFVGMIFLFVAFRRLFIVKLFKFPRFISIERVLINKDYNNLYQCTNSDCVGLELSIWYWHFVDVVWLFVFTCIYWWGC